MEDMTVGRIVNLSDARESTTRTHTDVEAAIKYDQIACSTGYCQCVAKDARIAELEAKCLGLAGQSAERGNRIVGLRQRISELEAEAAGLREDRERLDWMEAQMLKADCWLPGYNRRTKTWFVADESENEPTFRAALDAARKEGRNRE